MAIPNERAIHLLRRVSLRHAGIGALPMLDEAMTESCRLYGLELDDLTLSDRAVAIAILASLLSHSSRIRAALSSASPLPDEGDTADLVSLTLAIHTLARHLMA